MTDTEVDVESEDAEDVPRRGTDLRSLLLWIFLLILLAACLGTVWVSLRRTAETVHPIGTPPAARSPGR
jgi:hypothetical protein